jgi:hypothetical protein
MSDRCNWGGWCVRKTGHCGAHTASPPITTREWDERREEIIERHIAAAVTLIELDFPTPPWADLLD